MHVQWHQYTKPAFSRICSLLELFFLGNLLLLLHYIWKTNIVLWLHYISMMVKYRRHQSQTVCTEVLFFWTLNFGGFNLKIHQDFIVWEFCLVVNSSQCIQSVVSEFKCDVLTLKRNCTHEYLRLSVLNSIFVVLSRSHLRMGLPMETSWPRLRRLQLKKQPNPKEWWSLAGSKESWWVPVSVFCFFLL